MAGQACGVARPFVRAIAGPPVRMARLVHGKNPEAEAAGPLIPPEGGNVRGTKKPNSSARDWSTTKTAGGLVVANPNHTRRAGAKLRRERNPMSVAGRIASSTGQAATSPARARDTGMKKSSGE